MGWTAKAASQDAMSIGPDDCELSLESELEEPDELANAPLVGQVVYRNGTSKRSIVYGVDCSGRDEVQKVAKTLRTQ